MEKEMIVMKINLIHCIVSMIIAAAVVIAWYEHNFNKNRKWELYKFKEKNLYALKDAVFKVVMENEELKNAVFKDENNYERIKECIAEDFLHEFRLLFGEDKE